MPIGTLCALPGRARVRVLPLRVGLPYVDRVEGLFSGGNSIVLRDRFSVPVGINVFGVAQLDHGVDGEGRAIFRGVFPLFI